MAIFLGYFLLFALPIIFPATSYVFTKDMAYSWNDQARMATVESLVERRTFKIEYSKYGLFTGDKIMRGSSFYATKPPVLSFIGGMVYFPLHSLWPLLHGGEELTYFDHEDIIYPFVTLFTVGLSSALMLLFFYKALLLINIEERFRWWALLTLAFGSLVFTYSTVFNNHAFAAAWLFIGFYFILRTYLASKLPDNSEARSFKPRKLDVFLGGVCISLAGVCDLSGALVFLPLIFLLLIGMKSLRKLTPFFVLGALVWLVPHFFLNLKITGSLWKPIYLMRSAYITTVAGYYGEIFDQAEVEWYSSKRLVYVFHSLFGQRGALLYTPVLLFGFAGLISELKRNTLGLRGLAAFILGGVLLGYIYICFWPANWGGTSYGLRYAVTTTPILIFFSALCFNGIIKIGWQQILYKECAYIGGVFALIGAVYPWGAAGPLPQTNFSLFENLEYIGIDILDFILRN